VIADIQAVGTRSCAAIAAELNEREFPSRGLLTDCLLAQHDVTCLCLSCTGFWPPIVCVWRHAACVLPDLINRLSPIAQ
jgi:hypothetical protein